MNANEAFLFENSELSCTKFQDIPVNEIRPDPDQPRTYFDEEALSELRNSLALCGVIHPIGVVKSARNRWDLIYGERRWRGAELLGLQTIPARVYPTAALKIKLMLQLAENVHRRDLSLLELLGQIDHLRAKCVSPGAMARMMSKPEEWITAMLDISRDPLARALYEAGIMTHVGAWEAFCRLPESLRNSLLQSGETLSPLRCKKVLEAHEAQKAACQQTLNMTTTAAVPAIARRTVELSAGIPVVTRSHELSSAKPAAAGVSDSAKDEPMNGAPYSAATIRVALPLGLAEALLPENKDLLLQASEGSSTALAAVEQALIIQIGTLVENQS